MIEDLKHFRADKGHMERLLAAVAIPAVVMLIITSHTLAYHDEVTMAQEKAEAMRGRLEQNTALASHLNALVAACMNGGRFHWEDPHTKHDMAAICEVIELGRIR